MTEEKKEHKINIRHFSFKTYFRRVDKKSWIEYQELRKKAEKTDYDKESIKNFRKQLKEYEVEIEVTHRPSRMKFPFVIKTYNRHELIKKAMECVKLQRKAGQTKINKVSKEFDGVRYNTVGGVLEAPNLINSFASKLTINDPYANKKPRMINKTYLGIELEFSDNDNSKSVSDLVKAFQKASLSRYVCVTTDISCGHEVRVLLEENNFETHLTQIVQTIKDCGFSVNARCGTHVHLDMRRRDVKQVYKNFVTTQTVLRKLINRTRKKNKYCQKNVHVDFDKQISNGDRRYSINALAFKAHQTLEIRMHHGTLDAAELIDWVKFLITIANYQNVISKPVKTLKDARQVYTLDDTLFNNLRSKMRKLYSKKTIVGQVQLDPDEILF